MDEQGYDASDPKQVNNARKKAARAALERKEVVQAIMGQKQGRAFLYDYLTKCNTFSSPFTGIREQTDFNCGKQHIGHLIQEDIMLASPENYWKMITEAERNVKE